MVTDAQAAGSTYSDTSAGVSSKCFCALGSFARFYLFYLSVVHVTMTLLVQQPDRKCIFAALRIPHIDEKVQMTFVQGDWSLHLEEKQKWEKLTGILKFLLIHLNVANIVYVTDPCSLAKQR